MKKFLTTACAIGFGLGVALDVSAAPLDCARAFERLAETSRLWDLAFASGDPAAAIALRVHSGEPVSATDSDRLSELNAALSDAASSAVIALDGVQQAVAAVDASGQPERAKLQTSLVVIADAIQRVKVPSMAFIYASLSTVDCKFTGEEGYVADCAARKIAPFYLKEVEIRDNTVRASGGKVDREAIRRAMLGQGPVIGHQTVDSYAELKARAKSGLESAERVLRVLGCAR